MGWCPLSSGGVDRRAGTLARWFALALTAVSLGGCGALSSFNFWENKDETVFDAPADKLYNEGLFLLNEKNDARTAVKRFEEVDRQHPYSEWARKSLVMTAYANYQLGNYEDTIQNARRFLQLHPGSPDASYAQYLIGAAYYERIRDVSRDQDMTDKAITALDEVVRKYPSSEYAIAAKRKIDIARDQLAGKEMAVGRYYMDRRDFTGAINRFKLVVTRYQTTRHVEEALVRLTEAYLSLGIVGEAQTSAAVLGHNFPDSRWYHDAYALVRQKGLEPSENTNSWISQAFRRFGVG